jgi:cleavage and polyadenylation specificity factor subunit 1
MVRKKDGTWRSCGDFCCLNFATTADAYPPPRMLDFAARVADCSFFSKTDLCKGYYQMPVHPADIAKTDTTTLFGLSEFLRMPFGLRNAGDSFQRNRDRTSKDRTSKDCTSKDLTSNDRTSND